MDCCRSDWRRGLPEAEDASKAVGLIEEGIALSHKLAKGLQPVDVHAGGLMQALQEFAAATSDMFSVTCRFRCDAPILISDISTADHLYRIAQEATGNAVKHARASSIVIAGTSVEQLVWRQLRTCFDPEIPINVVDLGLVYEARIAPHPEQPGRRRVEVRMTSHRGTRLADGYAEVALPRE